MVARQHPQRLRIGAIAGNKNWEKLAGIAREFEVAEVCVFDAQACEQAESSGKFPAQTRLHTGMEGLLRLATLPQVDTVVAATVGTTGLRPAMAALEKGKDLALANKEILVMAGAFVIEAARRTGARILPLDSDHNAIFQCLGTEPREAVDRLILTASGGPFRDFTAQQMQSITKEQALRHPNWDMGVKVTIDSSTMANKGLEVIEAKWLFDMPAQRIDVVVHPQSLVHSMVQMVDGSVLAHVSPPHMSFAIQHALLYPERAAGCVAPLDFSKALSLDFQPPDLARFPCLRLAFEALNSGGTAAAIFNAANEVAVSAFVEDQIRHCDIARVIEATLEGFSTTEPEDLEAVLVADKQAREVAREHVAKGRS
jgi:1-deoxy-D-xylulose-5-phosphate reductoisomerase